MEAVELMSQLETALAAGKKAGRRRVGFSDPAHAH
jgi:hypothetical protein